MGQHNFVMHTSRHPEYQYKSNIRRTYLPQFATFMPFFQRGAAPIATAPITAVI